MPALKSVEEKKKTKSNERQAAYEKECLMKVDAELLNICDGILALVTRRAKKCQPFAPNETVTCENVSLDGERETE